MGDVGEKGDVGMMDENCERGTIRVATAQEILPRCLYRMYKTDGAYGLMLASGSVLAIKSITGYWVELSGRLRVDVDLLQDIPVNSTIDFIRPSLSGTTATINTSMIMMVFDL